jgi:hypothetical protein
MGSFDFVNKIKKTFQRNSKRHIPNHGYSGGVSDRTYLDPEKNFSYDGLALCVRLLVIQMHYDLTRYFESLPVLSSNKELAKKAADNEITYRVDPLAKKAEKDEASAIAFYEKVVAIYRDIGLRPPQFNFEPDVMDTKL